MRQKIRKTSIFIILLIFPVIMNFFSPYLIVQGSFNGIVSGSLLMFGSLFITSLVFGRLFCSWICAAGCLQDIIAESRTRHYNSPAANLMKWILWIPWMLTIIIGFISAGGIGSVQPMYFTETGVSVDEPAKWITYFMVIGIFMLLSYIFGKRAGCHSICWMSPFMILGRKLRNQLKIPAFHLSVNPATCTKCRKCSTNCPMSLDVQGMVAKGNAEHHECILCARCADGCPSGSIRFGFGTK